eukprot:CAMPEP_0117006638 /NCGR_PEP_ID=MMETSP0472-20121206/6796_1 /TAXON_ID=693140 ORGANISM="Tiarina fusus, Strain LIS" /NCGR_SAMPLE_ID=MMETSP0472 /ASSEMBLY_ACC=CAM_ASM_000603 /LENGTH=765 /DNA_ID=CAMNT_0004708163 /DNA_START=49 /DNA_END=2346 /DNA_ORIENTATION=-
MLDTSDSASDTSTFPNGHAVCVKNSNLAGVNNRIDSVGEVKQELEASVNASVCSFDEISQLGEDLHDSNSLYLFQDCIEEEDAMMKQDKELVQEKLFENEGTALQQMFKVHSELENLRTSLCQVRDGNGSELSREQKLISENEFLVQVNEILNLRLYRAVSMLEVEEDYSMELEAKIERLEAKLKERNGIINRLSASAVTNRSNKQMVKTEKDTIAKSQPPSSGKETYSELSDMLDTSVTMKSTESKASSQSDKKKDQASEPKRNQPHTRPDQRQGRRGLFQRSNSIGDLDYVGELGFTGPLANVLAGAGLNSDDDCEVSLNVSKKSGRRSYNKRSMSLQDLSCDEDIDTVLPTSSRRKDELGSASLHSALRKSSSNGELSSSLHSSLSKKSKSKRRTSKHRDGDLDAASSHSKKSLWDLSPSWDIDESSHSVASKKSRTKGRSKRSDKDLDTASSHSRSAKKNKSARKKGSSNGLDSVSMHSTSSKSKGKKKGRSSALRKSNSLGNMLAIDDLDSASSDDDSFACSESDEVPKPIARRFAFKRSHSVGDLVSEDSIRHAFDPRGLISSLDANSSDQKKSLDLASPTSTSSSKQKRKSKTKGGKNGFQRSSSHGDLLDGDVDDSMGERLNNSIHSIHSASTKSRRTKPKKAGKQLKFSKPPKRSLSSGDVQSTLEDAAEDSQATDALKYLIDDLWSKRKETPAAGKRIELGENLEALLKPKKLSPNLLTSLSTSTRPLPSLRVSTSGATQQGNSSSHSTKNATWD